MLSHLKICGLKYGPSRRGSTKAVLGKIQADPSLLASDPSYCRLQFSTHLFNCANQQPSPGLRQNKIRPIHSAQKFGTTYFALIYYSRALNVLCTLFYNVFTQCVQFMVLHVNHSLTFCMFLTTFVLPHVSYLFCQSFT